jgi:hypothetical protein
MTTRRSPSPREQRRDRRTWFAGDRKQRIRRPPPCCWPHRHSRALLPTAQLGPVQRGVGDAAPGPTPPPTRTTTTPSWATPATSTTGSSRLRSACRSPLARRAPAPCRARRAPGRASSGRSGGPGSRAATCTCDGSRSGRPTRWTGWSSVRGQLAPSQIQPARTVADRLDAPLIRAVGGGVSRRDGKSRAACAASRTTRRRFIHED